MNVIFELFIKNCGEEKFKKSFAALYEEAEMECESRGVFFLAPDYIRKVANETSAYPRIEEHLVREAYRVNESPALKKYALFIYKAMCDRKLFLENIKSFMLPEGYELFAFLCLIPMIRNTYERLTEMGIDADIVNATVRQYEECVFIYQKRYDRLGMNKRYFDWLQHYVDCEILNINRLRFEIHALSEPVSVLRNIDTGEDSLVMTGGEFNADGLYSDTPPKKDTSFACELKETENEYIASPVSTGGRAQDAPTTYPKDKYRMVIKKGDTVLSVHIPVEGELSVSACKESYERALKVFARFFPSLDIKGFVCYSWMMSPELSLYMKPESRVLGFASAYKKFPIHTEGEDVLNFVFYLKFKTYADLAEDTSLQRKLKRLYLDGGYLYEYGGIFAADKI